MSDTGMLAGQGQQGLAERKVVDDLVRASDNEEEVRMLSVP